MLLLETIGTKALDTAGPDRKAHHVCRAGVNEIVRYKEGDYTWSKERLRRLAQLRPDSSLWLFHPKGLSRSTPPLTWGYSCNLATGPVKVWGCLLLLGTVRMKIWCLHHLHPWHSGQLLFEVQQVGFLPCGWCKGQSLQKYCSDSCHGAYQVCHSSLFCGIK